jgi:osmotically-inducible protein OsmY
MWDPSVSWSDVKVSARDGVVTLTGTVPHYIEKLAAEHAAQRVGGVKGVADELEVKGVFDKTDEEIAREAINALKWNYSVPDNVKVAVTKGWLTLEGEADWDMVSDVKLLDVSGTNNGVGSPF